jgi:hypothetical protein
MARTWIGTWAGGRIASIKNGKGQRFILERKFKDRHWTFPLASRTPEDAEIQLGLWEYDPVAFIERHQAKKARTEQFSEGLIRLSDSVLTDLDTFMSTPQPPDRPYPMSWEHVRQTVRYAKHWMQDLKGSDLRFVTKGKLLKALDDRKTARAARIRALYTLCALLCARKGLDKGASPARHLDCPQSKAGRTVEERGYPSKTIEKVYGAIQSRTKRYEPDTAQAVRDVLRLRLYGLHHSEISRLAEGNGTIEDVGGDIAGVVTVLHKDQKPHAVSVDAWALAAARRLLARKAAPTDTCVREYCDNAAKAMKVGHNDPETGEWAFDPGNLRHSVVTLARKAGKLIRYEDQGLDLRDIVEVTGHQVTTARNFYLGKTVPPMLVLPIRVQHPEDPVPLPPKAQQA